MQNLKKHKRHKNTVAQNVEKRQAGEDIKSTMELMKKITKIREQKE